MLTDTFTAANKNKFNTDISISRLSPVPLKKTTFFHIVFAEMPDSVQTAKPKLEKESKT